MQDRQSPSQLTLQAVSCAGEPCTLVRGFGAGGGTIGRSPDCDLVLTDAAKTVSRLHARVVARAGGFVLCCLGANAILVDGRALQTGEEAPLADGATLKIGPYVLQARMQKQAAARVDIVANPLAPPPLDPPRPAAFGNSAPGGDDPLRHAGGAIDLFGGRTVAAAATPPPASFRGSESDQVAPQHLPMAGLTMQAIPHDYDPLADGQARAPAPVADSAVLRALLEGLGVPALSGGMADVELARLAGSLLREAVSGTMGALLARSLTKRESRIDVTVLAGQANNPLKFFPDTDSALTQMFTGVHRGYLSPQRAMASAFDDLRTHELAVIAATRAAVAGLVEALGPSAIERQLEKEGSVDKVFGGNRKARCWELYLRQHDELRGEALQRRFAERFSAAYEEQLANIHKARP